ncbi:hypothetical protein GGF32_007333 [Allomyces javanicus]|nr:hypothetical protein GGF32_007333 [Allomyces javanicus]
MMCTVHLSGGRSRLEALAEVPRDLVLRCLASVHRASLVQLARVSPVLYAPAMMTAIRTAGAPWVPLPRSGAAALVLPAQQCPAKCVPDWLDLLCNDAPQTIGRLAYRAPETRHGLPKVYLIVHAALSTPNGSCCSTRGDAHAGLVADRLRLLGPIPFHQLSSLHLDNETVGMAESVLSHARHVFMTLTDAHLAHAMLGTIESIGGMPLIVADLTVHLECVKALLRIERTEAMAFTERLAQLLSTSWVRHLQLDFDDDALNCLSDPMDSVQGEESVPTLLQATLLLLNHGLPARGTLSSLTLRGLDMDPLPHPVPAHAHPVPPPAPNPALHPVPNQVPHNHPVPHNGIAELPSVTPPTWPATLHHFELDLGCVAATLLSPILPSLPRHATMLESLYLATMDLRMTAPAIIAALSSSQRVFRLHTTPCPGSFASIHALLAALVQKCPHLHTLELAFGYAPHHADAELQAFARDTVPLLCGLRELHSVAMRCSILHAYEACRAVLDALASAVPDLCALDLAGHAVLDAGAVDALEPVLNRTRLKRLDVRWTKMGEAVRETLVKMKPGLEVLVEPV